MSNYNKLEESIASNPNAMYLEVEEVKIDDQYSNFVVIDQSDNVDIIEGYMNNPELINETKSNVQEALHKSFSEQSLEEVVVISPNHIPNPVPNPVPFPNPVPNLVPNPVPNPVPFSLTVPRSEYTFMQMVYTSAIVVVGLFIGLLFCF